MKNTLSLMIRSLLLLAVFAFAALPLHGCGAPDMDPPTPQASVAADQPVAHVPADEGRAHVSQSLRNDEPSIERRGGYALECPGGRFECSITCDNQASCSRCCEASQVCRTFCTGGRPECLCNTN